MSDLNHAFLKEKQNKNWFIDLNHKLNHGLKCKLQFTSPLFIK